MILLITATQLKSRLDTINHFSVGETGQNRLVYSPTWIQGQQQLIAWGQQAGMIITMDAYGNVYLDLPGTENPQAVIATGSHMDTVVHSGQYDGLYGVLGGLQAIENLYGQLGRPRKTLRLISFSEEEGSRFPTTFSGSKYYTRGETVSDLVDQAGTSFDTARQHAIDQLKTPGIRYGRPELPETFTELHIEQGPRLIDRQLQIGLVTDIVGQRRFTITVTGVANHAGTTPMSERHDALQATVSLITGLRKTAAKISPMLTFTVGELHIWPNTANVIPGKVTFTVDTRHKDTATLDQFETSLRAQTEKFSVSPMHMTVDRWVADLPTHLDDQLLQRNEQLANQNHLSYAKLVSGAGHDSAIMNQVTRTTMIFVPSIGGISHAPQEETTLPDLNAGTTLLEQSLRMQAY